MNNASIYVKNTETQDADLIIYNISDGQWHNNFKELIL